MASDGHPLDGELVYQLDIEQGQTNEEEVIEEFVNSLRWLESKLREKFDNQLELHIIIVDNASTDNTIKVLLRSIGDSKNFKIVRHKF